jgi:hypothetical protein
VSRLVACLVVALWSGWSAGHAWAEPQALSIVWQAEGATPCTKPLDAEAEVLRLAGASSGAATSFVVRSVALPDGRYATEVSVAGSQATSTRVLASCAEAREASLLLMAMALQPAAASMAPSEDAPADPPAAHAAARWNLSAAALVDHNTLSRTGFGFALGVSYALDLLRFGLTGRYLPARSVTDLPPDVEADLDWLGAALSGAAIWRFAALGVGPRLELELGALRGRAQGVEESAPASAFWIATSAGVELEYWFHERVGAQLVATLGVPLQRPQFAFADEAPFHTVAAYFVRGAIGLTFRLDPKDSVSTGQ